MQACKPIHRTGSSCFSTKTNENTSSFQEVGARDFDRWSICPDATFPIEAVIFLFTSTKDIVPIATCVKLEYLQFPT